MALVPDVIIIIVGFKSRGLLRTCLRSLEETSVGSKLNIKIVVVDNASGDGTTEMLRAEYPQVEVIANERNMGFAAGMNQGMASPARYYFLLNPDTHFPEVGLLDKMVIWMDNHPKIGMLGPRLMYPSGQIQPSCYRLPSFLVPLYHRTFLGKFSFAKKALDNYLMTDFDHASERAVEGIFGAAMLARREAVLAAGLMDDKTFFLFFEDIDWSRRFNQAGWPVMYVPQFSLVHYHGRPSAGPWWSIITNPAMRMHIKSWIKYFWKWRNYPYAK